MPYTAGVWKPSWSDYYVTLKYPLAKKLTERVSVGGGDSDALQMIEMKASSSKKSLCSPYFIFA